MSIRAAAVLVLLCVAWPSGAAAAGDRSESALRDLGDPLGGFRMSVPAGWTAADLPGTWLELQGPSAGLLSAGLTVQLQYRDGCSEELARGLLGPLAAAGVALAPDGAIRTVPGAAGPFTYLKTVSSGEDGKLLTAWGLYGAGRRHYLVKVKAAQGQEALLEAVAGPVLRSFTSLPRRAPEPALGRAYLREGAFTLCPPAGWDERLTDDGIEFETLREMPRVFLRLRLDSSELDFETARQRDAEPGAKAQKKVHRIALKSASGWGVLVDGMTLGEATYRVLNVVTGRPGRHVFAEYWADRDQFPVYWPQVKASLATLE